MEITFLLFTLISMAFGREELFYRMENSKLPTVPMDTYNVSSDMKCGFKCASQQNCLGFNYYTPSQECQLLDRSARRHVGMDYIHGAIGETLNYFDVTMLNICCNVLYFYL